MGEWKFKRLILETLNAKKNIEENIFFQILMAKWERNSDRLEAKGVFF